MVIKNFINIKIHFNLKMVKKLIFGLVVLILLVQITSALDTEIKIKTLPDHKVMISTLKPGEVYSLIKSFHENSGASGEVSVVLSSAVDNFDISVWVKQDNQVIISEKFENQYPSGTPVVLELYPEWYTKPGGETENVSLEENTTTSSENTAIINETETNIKEESENSEIVGFVIFGEQGFLSNKTIYYIIGIIALLIGFLLIRKIKKKSKFPKEIKIRKLSEVFSEKNNNNNDNKTIEDAERKIKEAQEEIRRIKNDDKIKEAEKKLLEDQKELKRLREGKE